jgi:stage V sporulation protein G
LTKIFTKGRRISSTNVEYKAKSFFLSVKVVTEMEITDVRLRRVNTEGRMKAIASITIDNEFVVHDIRVIDGNNGMFVAMPSKRTPDGEFRDIAHPISSATREKIQTAVLEEYERAQAEESESVIEEGA